MLASFGWDDHVLENFTTFATAGLAPARVIADYGSEYLVHDAVGQLRASASRGLRPSVGDWVALRRIDSRTLVEGIVERRTALSRHAASRETREQVLAANIDVVFVIAAATDVSPRRIERYLTIAWQSGASPVVLLTKADVADSLDDLVNELEAVAVGTPVVVTSSLSHVGLDEMAACLLPNRTGVLLGPSGVGKSTLINALAGEDVMQTRDIHRSGEGRHMTSHRQLVQLTAGGMIIDTPGLREAQLWAGSDALGNLFEDIERLALACRFANCAHRSEPHCAVSDALADGSLDPGRLASYGKLQRELRAVAARTDVRIRLEERRKWKRISMAARAKGVVRP